jgi:DNA-3-methyladenine glycosylase II
MRDAIRRVGPFTLKLQRDRFLVLVRAIISQQISTKAAESIRNRLLASVAPARPAAENLSRLSDEQLRSAGLSPQKQRYLRDLCGHVLDGRLNLRQIGRLRDEAVIEELVQVKGIGRWTAQMFLIFSLGRPDVLAEDDLGLRAAVQRIHAMPALPTKTEFRELAAPWRPYATVASWYCWRSADLKLLGKAK